VGRALVRLAGTPFGDSWLRRRLPHQRHGCALVPALCQARPETGWSVGEDLQIEFTQDHRVNIPDRSIVKLNIGDQIRLTAEEFDHLSAAFFAELERRFL
jgi:hypothetical protein